MQQDCIWLVSLENKAGSTERSWVHPDAEQEDFCGMGKMFPAQLQSMSQHRETHCGEPGLQRWAWTDREDHRVCLCPAASVKIPLYGITAKSCFFHSTKDRQYSMTPR